MIATAHATEFCVKFSTSYSIERCVLWQWYSVALLYASTYYVVLRFWYVMLFLCFLFSLTTFG